MHFNPRARTPTKYDRETAGASTRGEESGGGGEERYGCTYVDGGLKAGARYPEHVQSANDLLPCAAAAGAF